MSTDTEPRTSVTVPPGRYVLGDPCYSISDEGWDGWLADAGIDLLSERPGHILAAPYRGHIAFGIGTAHGDGSYEDNHGNTFGVDAGMIGLVHVDSVDYEAVPNPTVIEITTETVVYNREDGVITIGDHAIDTDPHLCDWCGSDIKNDYTPDGTLCRDCHAESERQAAACPDCGADEGEEYDGEMCWSCGLNAPDDEDESYDADDLVEDS